MLLGIPFRCCNRMKLVNLTVLVVNNNTDHVIKGFGRTYSKDKGSCCKDVIQTEGKNVEPWPKSEPPTAAWRAECPKEPQPPNYDPYRIKGPEVVVPPLPPSNAKRTGVVFVVSADKEKQKQPEEGNQAREQTHPEVSTEEPKDEGLVGLLKGLFEKIKGRGPCSLRPVPDPPPCPPPPAKPFPWIYVFAVASFLAIMGVIYKVYVWKEEREKLGENKPIWRPRRKVKRPFHEKDLPACVQYLIVGAGAAGWAAYRAIMEHDKKAKVFFITKEDVLPYITPPMSKHMWWNPDPPDIKTLNYLEDGRRYTMYLSECQKFMDPVKFYRKKTGPAVSIASGWCVLRVDADDHVAYVKTMCGEQPIYYERCLLAPGSKAKNLSVFKSAPKAVREKVTTVRTIRDLEIAYRKVKEAKRVVIIGGGCLGCELAWHLGRMNKVVERPPDKEPIEFVHMFKDKGIMSNILPEYLGEWAAEKIKCEGVTVMSKTQVYDAFESPDGRLELTLSNGTSIVADYVLVAVGANPRMDLAEPSFLEQDRMNGGFVVNTELEARTHLYVAGDAASLYSQWHDQRLRMDHYGTAEEQGYIAGANMTGYWIPCNMEPHFWLKLGDQLQMEVVGEVGACLPTVGVFKQCGLEEDPAKLKAVENASGDRPCYKKSEEYQNRYRRGILFYLRDEIVVGMIFWNIPPIDDRMEVVTELLRARPSYKDINLLTELVGFPETKCFYRSDEEAKEPGPCVKNWRVF